MYQITSNPELEALGKSITTNAKTCQQPSNCASQCISLKRYLFKSSGLENHNQQKEYQFILYSKR